MKKNIEKKIIESILVITSVFILYICTFFAIAYYFPGCTSPINVNVKIKHGNDTYNCKSEIKNSDGSTTWQRCNILDGDEPTNQNAVDGPDNIQSQIIIPAHSRLN